jgi:hypothetical protein
MRDTQAGKKRLVAVKRRNCKCLAKSLERDFGPDLPVSRELLADGSSKRPIRQVGIHKQIWMIKEIEKLKPHFEIDPLSYVGILVSGEIRLSEAWLPELLCLLVAIRT